MMELHCGKGMEKNKRRNHDHGLHGEKHQEREIVRKEWKKSKNTKIIQ